MNHLNFIHNKSLGIALAVSLCGGAAHSKDLFLLTGTDFSLGGAMQSISSDKLFEDIFGDDSTLNLFETSTNVDYELDYAGINRFIFYDVRPSGGSVTASFMVPKAGISETFSGIDRDSVDDQLEEFLKSGGFAKILQTVQENSLVAVTDGNPGSTTAMLANDTFEAGDASNAMASGQNNGFGVNLLADIRSFKADGFDGTVISLPLSFRIPLGDSHHGVLRVPLAYTKVGDAEAYHGGLQFAVPITAYQNDQWLWVVSPSGGVAASFSEDFGAGAGLWSAGLTSSLRRDFGSFYVTLGNHASIYEGIDIEVDDYDLGSELSQSIVKNGLKVSVPFAENRWEIEGYVIHTAFLEDAAVEDYVTPGIQLTHVLGENRDNGRLSIRLEGDFGSGYESVGLRFGGGFRF